MYFSNESLTRKEELELQINKTRKKLLDTQSLIDLCQKTVYEKQNVVDSLRSKITELEKGGASPESIQNILEDNCLKLRFFETELCTMLKSQAKLQSELCKLLVERSKTRGPYRDILEWPVYSN